jgi:cell division protein FtsL
VAPKALTSITNNAQNLAARIIDDSRSQITDKHLTNRSWFGLTSAGAFVYAHDLGSANPGASPQTNVHGVISELVLIPAGKLTTTPTSTTDTTAKVNKSTVMIRPVSDERGFEVIGHYRYGRGVSLTDGQLVQSPQGANTYQAANVSIQVALSGDLSAALQAQTTGITAVSSQYPNPVAAIASLQPDDLRTSGFTNPNTGAPSYGNSSTNFVDQPVLGSPQTTGVFPSVEASQLSQGRTLAEMTVLDAYGSQDGTGTTQPQCMCLLGRSDLAFINTGYQVKTLAQTAVDPSSLYDPNAFQAGTSPNTFPTSVQPTGLDPADQAAYQAAITYGTPLNQTSQPSPSPDQVLTTVDNFLFNLYQALDTPHQQYEQELRGGSFSAPQPGANGSTSVGPNSNLGDFAPPFSAPSRYAAGDITATAQMAKSDSANLTQAWSNFGQSLSANTQISSLSTTISNDQSNLTALQKQLAELQASTSGGSVSLQPNPSAQVTSLQNQIAVLQQKISNEQAQLGQLRNQVALPPANP